MPEKDESTRWVSQTTKDALKDAQRVDVMRQRRNKMKIRPITMKQWEVKAILEGRKTQTRRVVKLDRFQKSNTKGYDFQFMKRGCWQDVTIKGIINPPRKDYPFKCPYGKIGDRLWVRETFNGGVDGIPIAYKASNPELNGCPWKPPIYMPRWASRITLEITDIRVERLQEISEKDVGKEGTPGKFNGKYQCPDCNGSGWMLGYPTCKGCNGTKIQPKYYFRELWNSSYSCFSSKGWESNPWVWVVEFKVVGEK